VGEAELKERLLELLERDRSFRYAVMGLLGFREILERVTRIEERQQKLDEGFRRLYEMQLRLAERQQRLEERQQRLEERAAKLEERFARLEERFAQLEERFARLEERYQKLEERFARLEERFAKLEERVVKLEERYQKLEERFAQLEEKYLRLEERMARLEQEMRETRRVLAVIAHRFGVLSEAGLREALKYVVEEVLGAARVEKKVLRDEEGLVYGYPAVIDVDVMVRGREHVIVEIKSGVSRSDVAEIYRIGGLYETRFKVKPGLLIVGSFVDPEAKEVAVKLGVEIKPVVEG
jgi:hypothetical protein